MENTLIITWLGHACFKLEQGGRSVVIDPYEDHNVPGLKPLRETAGGVLYSHTHDDHHGTGQISVETISADPFEVSTISTFHDDQHGILRGTNLIHRLTCGPFRAIHFGDLGCALTPAQAELLMDADVIMIPVGGYYTINAAQAKKIADQIRAKIVIPMHYRSDTFGYDEIDRLESYTSLCDNVMIYSRNFIEIHPDSPKQTAVLTLCQTDQHKRSPS